MLVTQPKSKTHTVSSELGPKQVMGIVKADKEYKQMLEYFRG